MTNGACTIAAVGGADPVYSRVGASGFDYGRRAALPADPAEFLRRRDHLLSPELFPLPPLGLLPPAGPDFDALASTLADALAPAPLATLPVRTPEGRPILGKARGALNAANLEILAAHRPYYDRALEYFYMSALYRRGFAVDVTVKGRRAGAAFVSGSWPAHEGRYGPAPARVVVVGKSPGFYEVAEGRNFVGPTSDALWRALAMLGTAPTDLGDWYITNLVKHMPLDPASATLAKAWVANCAPLLAAELLLCRPDFVLCFGSEASQHLLGPKGTVTRLYGRVVTHSVPASLDPPARRQFRVMATVHPAYVSYKPEAESDLINGLGMFAAVVRGERTDDAERDVRHCCIYTEAQLRRVVDRILARSRGNDAIAVDCEWHGKHPGNAGSYLRTVQFSHRPKHAYCVVLHHQGGRPAFRPGPEAARRQLLRLLKSAPGRTVRVGGHFLRADLPWLMEKLDVDLRDEYAAPASPALTKTSGGWDTGYMVHAFQEAMEGGYKLENLASRFCGVPRYDVALQAWKDGYCAEHGLKDKELEGYGQAPDEVLHAYANYDADATIRLFWKFNGVGDAPGLLDRDQHGNSSRRAFWTAHRSALAALEMERNGVALDRARGDALTAVFAAAQDDLGAALRARLGWEDAPPGADPAWKAFNHNSANQCRDWLYGTHLNGTRDKDTGECRRLRPPHVASLGLTPIKAAGQKRPPTWEKVVAAGEVDKYNPSTDKESLGIFSHLPPPVGPLVGTLRDVRFLAQVLKGVLKRPYEDNDGEPVYDEDGNLVYDGGLMYWIDDDGRVRTNFYPVETGRWSSSRPNLHNVSKRREDDYKAILGYMSDGALKGRYTDVFTSPRYLYPIRSMITAAPGCVLVEADYKMAEMAMIGWQAQDPTMIEHVRRNSLPKKHPDFIDLHALTAINAFHLDTPGNRATVARLAAAGGRWDGLAWGANKDVLAALGKSSLRVAAKNVNFGVPYGRSAEAIARQCREEGADVSVEEAQLLIDAYKKANYPQIAAFLDRCAARPLSPGWMCGPFGRHRRFARTSDRSVVAEQQRAAMNYTIQNGVADTISIACGNIYDYRAAHRGPETFRMCLQIHDALLFEVPYDSVDWLCSEVLPRCMRDGVDIWPRDLDGRKLAAVKAPYHLDIDTSVERYWGQEIDREWGLAVGVPEKYLPKAKKAA